MIRIDHMRLRSITRTQHFGGDIPLSGGLNIIQADNTSGKSTALQSIIFALGLERSLGPKLTVPLPLAMRERIQLVKDGPETDVLQSYVMVQLSNDRHEVMTVRRDVTGGDDPKLVKTWNGAIVETGSGTLRRQDFFLHSAGSAKREAGFHHHLAAFIGWDLPLVPTYDGDEVLLYLEALFPMFFVEQKRGWSVTQGPFPTYLGIQDLPRRVMEFILNLDAGRIRREKAELRKRLKLLETLFREGREEMMDGKGSLLRLEGLPRMPTAEFASAEAISLAVYHDGQWQPLEEATQDVRKTIAEFDSTIAGSVEIQESDLGTSLLEAESAYETLSAQLATLRNDYQLAKSEKSALEKRVDVLEIDLARNKDALKLQNLGSTLGSASSDGACPTCQQSVATELLPAVSRSAMGLEDNIAFIRSQLDLYRSMLGSATEAVDVMVVQYQSLRTEIAEVRSRVRSLKSDLLRSPAEAARSDVEAVIRLEVKLEQWEAQRERVDSALDDLKSIAREWLDVMGQFKAAGSGNLTALDRKKVSGFEDNIQLLLRKFGFVSFKAADITLSQDDFKPLVRAETASGEDVVRDIGFEASASDGIRLKWAYLLALLILSKTAETRHLGVSIFDEPGQQQMKELDLGSFFVASANAASGNRQVIITTSEVLERVENTLESIEAPAAIHPFEDFLLKPLS